MTSLRNTVLLYRPSLSVWTARKKDKAESAKVNKEAGAVDGAANVHKQLLPDCQELEDVTKWANSFRTFIYLHTETWDDSGLRCGHVAKHMDFMAEAGDRMAEGYLLVDAFIDKYQQAIENAKFTLAHMFNASDYYGAQEVRSKFRFSIDVSPLPEAEDFRIVEGMPQSEVDRLVGIATASVEARIAAAMREAYQRLYGVVAKMANTLEQYGDKSIKKFNDTLVENIAEIVDVMPALNLTNDPQLAALATEAKNLATYSPVDLRKDDKVREAAIKEARTLAVKFRGLIDGSMDAPAPAPQSVTVVSARVTADVFADMMEV